MRTLRDLPSVSALLTTGESSTLRERFGRRAATGALRSVLSEAREAVRSGSDAVPSDKDILLSAFVLLERQDQSTLRPLFNLTGIVLHTNLGRAVLSESAIEAATSAMRDAVGSISAPEDVESATITSANCFAS